VKKYMILQYNSPVVLTFGLISFFALLLGNMTDFSSTRAVFSVYSTSFQDLRSPLFYIRLFGHVLGHYNFEHFFNNMIMLLLLGPIMEEKYGYKRVILMIVITAFITGIVHIVFFGTILLGASGIVFMFMLLASFTNIRSGKIPLTLVLCVIIFIGREIHDAITANDNISQAAHIIGGILGAIFGFYANRKGDLKTA